MTDPTHSSHKLGPLQTKNPVGSPLDTPDTLILRAAEGWLELGNVAEAQREWEQISLPARFHPQAMTVRWEIFARIKNWEFAYTVAQGLVSVAPHRPEGWINRSIALHALKRTVEAWASLLPAALKFPQDPVIAYNLACYASQLGKFGQAYDWLQKASQMQDGARYKWASLKDPDLQPMWEHFGAQPEGEA